MNQHKNGVSPRNQSFHARNGESICWIVGIILLCAFLKAFLIGVVLFIVFFILLVIGIDLWRNI